MRNPDRLLVLGRVVRAHGVHGGLIIAPLVEDPGLILAGGPLKLVPPDGGPPRPVKIVKSRPADQGLIVKIADVSTREEAARLKGWQLALPRADMPPLAEDEFYWDDLIGFEVRGREGIALGRLAKLMEAGSGLILVVTAADNPDRELLIPEAFLEEVDLSGGLLTVDPPPGLLELY